jgi:hypothetical protein
VDARKDFSRCEWFNATTAVLAGPFLKQLKSKLADSLNFESSMLSNQFNSISYRVILIVVPPVIAIILHALATSSHIPHESQIVNELGSVLTFAGRPIPNHAVDKFIFLRYRTLGTRTNDTWAMYIQRISDGARATVDIFTTDTWRESWLYEQVRTFGWSPDDRYFSYCRNEMKELVVYDISAERLTVLGHMNESLTSGAWLTPEVFACSDGKQVITFEKSESRWRGPTRNFPFEAAYGTNLIENLQAYSSNTLLWQQNAAIWSSTRNATRSVEVWQPPAGNQMDISFACSMGLSNVLILAETKENYFLADCYPGTAFKWNVFSIIPRLHPAAYKPTLLRQFPSGSGYSYLNESDFGLNYPMVFLNRDRAIDLPWRGEIKSYEIRNNQLFVIGAISNEPVGIWQYDCSTKRLKAVVSSTDIPFHYATSQSPICGTVTKRSGGVLNYYLLPPARVKPHCVPPLVVGILGNKEKSYYWDRYAQTIVNWGAYFVTVDRRDSLSAEWAEDTLSVYYALQNKVYFDSNNLFLLAISSGADAVCQLLESEHVQWRGAMFLSPTTLPEFGKLEKQRILVDIGSLDETWGEGGFRAKEYCNEAAKAGLNVTLLVRPGVGHNCRLLSVERQRLHELVAFLDSATQAYH